MNHDTCQHCDRADCRGRRKRQCVLAQLCDAWENDGGGRTYFRADGDGRWDAARSLARLGLATIEDAGVEGLYAEPTDRGLTARGAV